MDEIRKRLLDAYNEKGLSYAELEEKTGIPAATINRYVNGITATVPTDRMEKLAKALNVDLLYLIGFTDVKTGFDPIFEDKINKKVDDIVARANSISGPGVSSGISFSISPGMGPLKPITDYMPKDYTVGEFGTSSDTFATSPDYDDMLRQIGDALPRSSEENELLALFRALDGESKKALLRVARAFLIDNKQ